MLCCSKKVNKVRVGKKYFFFLFLSSFVLSCARVKVDNFGSVDLGENPSEFSDIENSGDASEMGSDKGLGNDWDLKSAEEAPKAPVFLSSSYFYSFTHFACLEFIENKKKSQKDLGKIFTYGWGAIPALMYKLNITASEYEWFMFRYLSSISDEGRKFPEFHEKELKKSAQRFLEEKSSKEELNKAINEIYLLSYSATKKSLVLLKALDLKSFLTQAFLELPSNVSPEVVKNFFISKKKINACAPDVKKIKTLNPLKELLWAKIFREMSLVDRALVESGVNKFFISGEGQFIDSADPYKFSIQRLLKVFKETEKNN
jgi:hypothetical protein